MRNKTLNEISASETHFNRLTYALPKAERLKRNERIYCGTVERLCPVMLCDHWLRVMVEWLEALLLRTVWNRPCIARRNILKWTS